MEPASFAVGIIGLAGLFNACLDAASRIDSWIEYENDYLALKARYQAEKLRLERWGLAVGLEELDLSDEYNHLLDDTKTNAAVKDLLLAIEAVCRGEEKVYVNQAAGKEKQSSKDHLLPRHGSRDSKREKLRRALGAKAKRVAQIEKFTSLVQNLHDLVPINNIRPGKSRSSTFDEAIVENKTWKNDLQEILRTIEALIQDEIRRDIHTWILHISTSPSELYEILVERRIEGTCDWVLDRPWFLDWTSSTFPDEKAKILWINGSAGFGKSIICAWITYELLSKLEPLGYFFISSDFESRRDPFIAIRSWLSQLLRNPTVFALVHETWANNFEQKATRGDTLKLLRKIVMAVPGCTFILDGLDECSLSVDEQPFNQNNAVVDFLSAIRKAFAGTSTRLLIVSRDEPEIRRGLSQELKCPHLSVYQYRIQTEDVQPDIEAF